jgi:23S rRNA (uracil1939-C5)-methyltransferase
MHDVSLDGLAFGGDAVGRLHGKVVFVPFGAPGDLARVRILKETGSYCRGELLDVLEPSPSRREAACPLFGECGGCQWQHVTYAAQQAAKSEIFEQALVEAEPQELAPLTAARQELGYRRRVRMHFVARAGVVTLGYYRWRSQALIDVTRCPLLVESLYAGLDHCRTELRRIADGRGTVVALAGSSGEVHLSVRLDGGEARAASTLAERLGRAGAGGEVQCGSQTWPFGAPTVNLMPPEEPPLLASASVFAQASADQDHVLRRRVASWASARGARVLELFAGIGNLTRHLAQDADELFAVEGASAGASLLLRNLGERGATVLAQDAEAAVRTLIRRQERFDVVVLDPPREGCPRLMSLLPELGASRVVYVSCDPMTLGRDLKVLRQHGFQIERAQALDMMPQTFHVEGMALLTR